MTYFRIVDPFLVTTRIANPHEAVVERTKTALRQAVGARIVHSVIAHRKALGEEILEDVGTSARIWGIAVEDISIDDIKLPRNFRL